MTLTQQIAKNIRAMHSGGNWTGPDMKQQLDGIDWKQATTKISNFNTIATLVFHMNYYFGIQIRVLEGGPLKGKDELSFDHPPINSEVDWQAMVNKTYDEAEQLAILVEKLPDERLHDNFVDEKYGSYFRNLMGILEHTHYHLGQITFLRKILEKRD